FAIYHAVTQRARYMVPPEVWPSYCEHYRMGQALYIDQYYALRTEPFLGDYLLPEERPKWMEHNTYWALYTADRYVWCYSERMDWWNKKQVPAGCEEAIRDARANVNSGKPLGFSLEPIVADAQKRRTEAREAARYTGMSRRPADIVRAPTGSAPLIDRNQRHSDPAGSHPRPLDGRGAGGEGNLNKPVWENIAPLPPFVLIGS